MADHRSSHARTGAKPVPMAMAGAVALAGAIALALWSSDDRTMDRSSSPDIAIVRADAASAPSAAVDHPATPGGAAIAYELHGIDGATAWLAPHEGQPRRYRVGDHLSAMVTLAAIRRGSVLLREGGRSHRIDLPPRLGGSGEAVAPAEQGLRPTPQPPTGERSGAAIADRLAALPPPMPLPGDAEQGSGASVDHP